MRDILEDFFSLLLEFFVILHTMGFEMIGEFSYNLQEYGFGMAILWVFLGISLILSGLLIDAMIIGGILFLIYEIQIMIRTKKVRRIPVIGIVKTKKHKKAYTTCEYNVVFEMPMPKFHTEKYNVEVEGEGVTETFNSKKLFKEYEKNDAIPLVIVQNLDKNNKIIKQKLELPE